jgi:hypothetical protein
MHGAKGSVARNAGRANCLKRWQSGGRRGSGGATRGTGDHPFIGKLECDIAEFTIANRTDLALAAWGFLSLGGAIAGTCVNRQDGTGTVQACDNDAYTVTDRHGRRRVYGTPNGGFDRYPGQGERPVYRRRD